jgi:hypothetical protein
MNYSIKIVDEQNAPMMTGVFQVEPSTNTVVYFWDTKFMGNNILLPPSENMSDNLYLPDVNKFSSVGLNISSFPYLQERGDTSAWFNLATLPPTASYYQYGFGDYIQSEYQYNNSKNQIYELYKVKMTIESWLE